MSCKYPSSGMPLLKLPPCSNTPACSNAQPVSKQRPPGHPPPHTAQALGRRDGTRCGRPGSPPPLLLLPQVRGSNAPPLCNCCSHVVPAVHSQGHLLPRHHLRSLLSQCCCHCCVLPRFCVLACHLLAAFPVPLLPAAAPAAPARSAAWQGSLRPATRVPMFKPVLDNGSTQHLEQLVPMQLTKENITAYRAGGKWRAAGHPPPGLLVRQVHLPRCCKLLGSSCEFVCCQEHAVLGKQAGALTQAPPAAATATAAVAAEPALLLRLGSISDLFN